MMIKLPLAQTFGIFLICRDKVRIEIFLPLDEYSTKAKIYIPKQNTKKFYIQATINAVILNVIRVVSDCLYMLNADSIIPNKLKPVVIGESTL